MKELIKQLCALHGVSGHEEAVRDFIEKIAAPHADEIITDNLGNLLVYKKGTVDNGKTVMLCAHMDEVGLIIKGITDDGYMKFGCVGGIDRRVLVGQRFFIGSNRIPGVTGLKPKHLSTEDERKKLPKLEDMYIDAGYTDKASAEADIELGEYVVFDDKQVEFGDGMFKAKALDDRVGCAALLKLMEKSYPCGVWYVFTVQEEIGTRGAYVSAFRLTGEANRRPDAAIIVEGTTAADIPSLPAHRQICRPGGGVVIPFMDGGTVYDRELGNALKRAAVRRGHKWQTKEYVSGGTDAAAVQRTRDGIKTAGVALAVRYIHTPVSAVKLDELTQMTETLEEFLGGF